MSYSLYADLDYVGDVATNRGLVDMTDALRQFEADHPLTQLVMDGIIIFDSEFVNSMDELTVNAGEAIDATIDNLVSLIKKAALKFPTAEILIISDGLGDEEPPDEFETAQLDSPDPDQFESDQEPVTEAAEDDCGANAPGGGGFQPGNTCASGDGQSSDPDSPRSLRLIDSNDHRALFGKLEEMNEDGKILELNTLKLTLLAGRRYSLKSDEFKKQWTEDEYVDAMLDLWKKEFPRGFPSSKEKLLEYHSGDILSFESRDDAERWALHQINRLSTNAGGYHVVHNEVTVHYGKDTQEWLRDVRNYYDENAEPLDPKTQKLLFDISPEQQQSIKASKYGDFLTSGEGQDWDKDSQDYWITSFKTTSEREFRASVSLNSSVDIPYSVRRRLGIEYNPSASTNYNNLSVASFAFSDERGSFEITNRGEAVEVIKKASRTLFDAFDEFNPHAITFSAEGGSRVKLYESLSKRANKWTKGDLIPVRFYDGHHPNEPDASSALFMILRKEYADFLSDLEKHDIYEGEHYDRLD